MSSQTTETTVVTDGSKSRPGEGLRQSKVLFARPHALTDAITNYCPGCSHGIIQRLVAECLDELGIEGQTIGVCPVGCSVTAYDFYNCDMVQASHGRAPAVATGLKRANPKSIVFTYQGDGDLASIGTAETVHAATRGEKITTIFVNNAIYGMTGGQMAPTSLPGQVTQTSPYGRDVATVGYPIRVCELLSTLDGVALAQRVTVNNPKNVRAAKKAILKGFQYQIDGLGFSIIEVLATCPTNWGLEPKQAFTWLNENMVPYYPLGVYKDVRADAPVGGSQASGSQANAAQANAAQANAAQGNVDKGGAAQASEVQHA